MIITLIDMIDCS